MKNMMKILTLIFASLLLANCSSHYSMKSESGKTLTKVPKWYMNDFSEKKACDTSTFGKNKDRVCIFGVGTAVSPDLNLAIEKGMMIAKAELADIIKGEMNKQSKQFVTELGKTQTKTVVSEVESTIVNLIKDTPVRGYEIFEKDVTITKNGYYRSWVGLRLPMGEFNKMYNYTIEQATDAYNLKSEAKAAWDNLMNSKKDKNENNSVQ
jgi:hypothetical protein